MIGFVKKLLFDHDTFYKYGTPLILLGELVLCSLIVLNVAYTEIDWIAYMQEVGGFLGGDWDYGNLEGDTGPLVYPAGFVYLYSVFYWVTGKGADIRLAQWIFVGLYVLFIWVVLEIYNKTRVIPPWAVILVCASRRIHSIFVLRLFNDCFAVLFLYIAVWLFIKNRWSWGCFWFSLAVSIKMNILLFAPSLLILMWKRFGFWGTIPKLAICASLQVLLALPFLYEDAWDYFGRAFEFRRQFKYIWTVNLKFLPEELFLNKTLALCLLLCHVSLLLLFLHLWEKKGLAGVFKQSLNHIGIDSNPFTPARIATGMFVGNFIGIAFARSLHYQFYVWYYHTLPYMLWLAPLPNIVRLAVLVGIEYCWNVFPATPQSSGLLVVCHAILLAGIFVYTARNSGKGDLTTATATDGKKKE